MYSVCVRLAKNMLISLNKPTLWFLICNISFFSFHCLLFRIHFLFFKPLELHHQVVYLISQKINILFYMYGYFVCVYIMYMPGTHRGQKVMLSDPLRLELQMIVVLPCGCWHLETPPLHPLQVFCKNSQCSLPSKPCLQPPLRFLNMSTWLLCTLFSGLLWLHDRNSDELCFVTICL